MPIQIRRMYDEPRPDDGRRLLVDRLWPRGVARDESGLDDWLRELAPSPELRRWFDHDLERWPTFTQRYRAELAAQPDDLRVLLRDLAGAVHDPGRTVTLVTATRDPAHSHAAVLRDYLQELAAAVSR